MPSLTDSAWTQTPCCEKPYEEAYGVRNWGRTESCQQPHKPRQRIKKQRHYFADKSLYSQSYGLSSSHVWMWELDHKEGWTLKNWCFWTVVLEKTLESPLDSFKPVNSKGNQPWIFIGRTDAEGEAPILGTYWRCKRAWCKEPTH